MSHPNNKSALAPSRDSMMRARQRPLMRLYRREPHAARIVDRARTTPGAYARHDAVHGELRVGSSQPIDLPFSIHSAIGGDHDGPNPGDFLAAALAGCLDSTFRIIANRYAVELEDLSVSVRCEVDVRGTLCIDPKVQVGFDRVLVDLHVLAPKLPDAQLHMLVAATEHCCVVLQTLKGGVPVELRVHRSLSPAC